MRYVLIPATNKEISGDNITLKEFYVYLGYHFFMHAYGGISDQRLWWSPKTRINLEKIPLPDAEVIGPLKVHINYLFREVYKQVFSFIFA